MKGDVYYVNSDKIDYIQIRKPIQLDYTWFEAIQPKYKFFGLIKCREGQRAGWAESERSFKYYGGTSTKRMEDSDYQQINGKWYKKTHMYIRMGRSYISEHYNDLNEAIEIANKLSDKSKSGFQILIEKT